MNQDNLKIFNQIREVPDKAKKPIKGGRLSGMTDIKPMWRIEKLTELFGICGIGWKYKTTKREIIEGGNDEKIAVVDIELYIKVNGEWSEPIEGTGGSSFVSKERTGLYTSDECFKMATTDALSVACKNLGMGADVYWGDSKYDKGTQIETKEDAESFVLTFTKHKGKTMKELVDTNMNMVEWLVNNSKDENVLKAIEILTGLKPLTEEEVNQRLELINTIEKLEIETDTDHQDILDHYDKESTSKFTTQELRDASAILLKKKIKLKGETNENN